MLDTYATQEKPHWRNRTYHTPYLKGYDRKTARNMEINLSEAMLQEDTPEAEPEKLASNISKEGMAAIKRSASQSASRKSQVTRDRIVGFVRKRGQAASSEIMLGLDMSKGGILPHLRDLADQGRLIRIGSNRWIRYIVADAELPEEYPPCPTREGIMRVIRERGTASTTEIAKELGKTPQAIRGQVRRLVDSGELERFGVCNKTRLRLVK